MPEPSEPPRPLPEITPLTRPYWEAARRHELVLQRCTACDRLQFPPEPGCFGCGSPDLAWIPVSHRGRLVSWTITYPPLLPWFADRAPWPVAVVQLDAGPRMITNLINIPPEDYRLDLELEATFEDVTDEVTLVKFRQAPPSSLQAHP